jgi:hypothetical protein
MAFMKLDVGLFHAKLGVAVEAKKTEKEQSFSVFFYLLASCSEGYAISDLC